jgi:hypothetical protein
MKKKIPKKLISRTVIIYNLTNVQDGNTKVKFMLRILEKLISDPKQDRDNI